MHKINGFGKIGVIEDGKSADIIAVDGNPLQDIAALDKIKMVMKGGIFIKIEGIEFAVQRENGDMVRYGWLFFMRVKIPEII